MTVCIQCAMEDLLADQPIRTFAETPEEHARRVHPDQLVTQARRRELERLLSEKFPDGIPGLPPRNDPRRI